MADYSAFLYDSLAGIGEGMWKRKQDRLAEDQWNKSYAQRLLETEQDQKWRESEAARSQANADRSYALDLMRVEGAGDNVSPGYRRTPDGTWEPVPGGPADPNTIRSQADARRAPGVKARPLTRPTINDLSAAGTGVSDLGRLSETWNDQYGGFGTSWWGDFNNWAGRNMPGAAPQDRERATWWQDYQGYKNTVRHNLFGSALTATERAEFEKAIINPGMSPEAIKANLELQRNAAERAARKLANAYLVQGYPPDQIEAALGIPLEQLGLTPPGASAPDGAGGDPQAIVDSAIEAIQSGADPEAVKARLEQMGIDPSILDGGQ